MKKNTYIVPIFIILMILSAFLFFFLFKEKNSTFWISFITTELSLMIMTATLILYNNREQYGISSKSSLLSWATVCLIATAFVNILFGRFVKVDVKLYVAVQIIIFVLFIIVCASSFLTKQKRSMKHRRIEEDVYGHHSLLAEIQRLETTVSNLNPDIHIDVESMLLSLDKEIRYADIPLALDAPEYNNYLREKVFSLAAEINKMIDSQTDDKASFESSIIEIKQILSNPNIEVPKQYHTNQISERNLQVNRKLDSPQQLDDFMDDFNVPYEESESYDFKKDFQSDDVQYNNFLADDPENNESADLKKSKKKKSKKGMDSSISGISDLEKDFEALLSKRALEEKEANSAEIGSTDNIFEEKSEVDSKKMIDRLDAEPIIQEDLNKVREDENDSFLSNTPTPVTPISDEFTSGNSIIDSFKARISEIEALAKDLSSTEESVLDNNAAADTLGKAEEQIEENQPATNSKSRSRRNKKNKDSEQNIE